MNRRIAAFVVLAIVLAALFIRLGFWQLDRRAQRRAYNAGLASRLAEPETPFAQLRGDRAFRRTVVSGVADYANEIVFTGRSRNGSPGVYLLTPIRPGERDTAVLVIRGWVYSPDAATVDLARWREERTTYTGYVNALPAIQPPAESRASERKLRTLSANGVRALVPYPIAAHYVVSQDSATGTSPARLPLLTLDDGPHLSYAIQWFAFAVIALGGAGAVVSRARAGNTAGAPGA